MAPIAYVHNQDVCAAHELHTFNSNGAVRRERMPTHKQTENFWLLCMRVYGGLRADCILWITILRNWRSFIPPAINFFFYIAANMLAMTHSYAFIHSWNVVRLCVIVFLFAFVYLQLNVCIMAPPQPPPSLFGTAPLFTFAIPSNPLFKQILNRMSASMEWMYKLCVHYAIHKHNVVQRTYTWNAMALPFNHFRL